MIKNANFVLKRKRKRVKERTFY